MAYHLFTGLSCLVHLALFKGLTLVIMPKFEIEKFCSIVQNYKITFAYVVPPIVLLLSKHPIVDKYDLSTLRMMNSGAAPLTRELVDALYERIKVPVKQGYGLSETSPTTHTQVNSCQFPQIEKITANLPSTSSPGKTGNPPSVPSVSCSPTKQPCTCLPTRKKSPSVNLANSGSKAPTSSKATGTTLKAPPPP